ncbi:MAG: cation-efflux pump [Candidatus Bathyarchaeota archaeon]|nr:cation-efflux pump [Candidatus Bathyarchaeota archaeon]
MRILSLKGRSIEKVKALKYSTLAIMSVFLAEVFSGLIVNSLAILSDSLHAFFDVLSTTILLVSAHASLKPPDEEHMYGHEKFELLGGLIGGFSLMVLAAYITIESALRIFSGGIYVNLDLSIAGFFALIYTLSIDFLRIFIFRLVSERSSTITAGFYHAFSDFGSTIIALIGYWLSTQGIFYGDSVASIILGALLISLSVRFIWRNAMELSDIAPRETVIKVREEISKACRDLFGYESLKIRKIGGKLYVRATLKIPDYMSFEEAHSLASKIEEGIRREFRDADIYFHIEPTGMNGMSTREFIEKLVSKIGNVEGVHDVNIFHYDGKIYVTLHVQVNPSMPISKAHDLANKIEESIYRSVGNIENILVHLEPSNIEFSRGHVLDEKGVEELVHIAAEKYGGRIKVRRVISYTVDGKLCINIECSLSEDVSVEEAHKIATEIEESIRSRVSEAIVSVHVEPKDN